MNKKMLFGRALIWFIAVYHVIAGLFLMISGEISIKLAKSLAGYTIAGSAELGILGEILACYLIAFGVMMGIAAWNPLKNQGILSGAVILFLLRLIQRVTFSDKVMDVFKPSPASYWTACLIVTAIAVCLIIFLLWLRKAE